MEATLHGLVHTSHGRERLIETKLELKWDTLIMPVRS